MPTKKSSAKKTTTSKKGSPSKKASGTLANAKKAVGKVVSGAGDGIAGAVKAVLPAQKRTKKGGRK